MDAILRRILEELGAPGLLDGVARLQGADLTSLQLAIARVRTAAVTPAALLAQMERGGLVAPSPVSARTFAELDRAAFAAAPAFEAIELAPVAPFGTDAVLGGISPNNTLVATRPAHVPGDPTTELALLAAARRRRDRGAPVRLIASQRVVRLQPFPPGQGFSPHFKLLGAVTAGRGHAFELAALHEQIAMLLSILAACEPLGYGFAPVEVAISDTALVLGLLAAAGVDAAELDRVHGIDADGGAGVLAARGLALPRDLSPAELSALPAGRRLAAFAADGLPALRAAFPAVRFRLDGGRLAGLHYYDGLTLMLRATDASGALLPLGDGGFTPWTQRLLADRKERLLTSGIGLELVAKRFAAITPSR